MSIISAAWETLAHSLETYDFPETEAEILSRLPLQWMHIALLMSFPYAGGVIAAAISKKYFKH